jgi:hypothetical protein
MLLLASCGATTSSVNPGTSSNSNPASSSSSAAPVDPAVLFNQFQASGETFYEQDNFGFSSSNVNATASVDIKDSTSTSSASSSVAASSTPATYTETSLYLDDVYFDARFNHTTSTTGADLDGVIDFYKPNTPYLKDQGQLGVEGLAAVASGGTAFVPRFYLNDNTAYIDYSKNATLRLVTNALIQAISGDSTWLFPQTLKGYKDLPSDKMDLIQPLSTKLKEAPALYAEAFKSAYKTAPDAFSFASGDTKQFVFSSTDNTVITNVAIAMIEAELTELTVEQKTEFEDTTKKVLACAKWNTFSFGWTFNEKTWLTRSINVNGTFDEAKEKEVLGSDAAAYISAGSLSTKIAYTSGSDAAISFPNDLNKTSYTEIPDVKVSSSSSVTSSSAPTTFTR